jgi:hypothetical protein
MPARNPIQRVQHAAYQRDPNPLSNGHFAAYGTVEPG